LWLRGQLRLGVRRKWVLFLLLMFSGAECVAATESVSCPAAESKSGTVTSLAGTPIHGRALVVLEEGITWPRERVPWFVPVRETTPDPSGDFRLCGGHGGALLLVIAAQDSESPYPATLIPDVKSGTSLGKIAVGAPASASSTLARSLPTRWRRASMLHATFTPQAARPRKSSISISDNSGSGGAVDHSRRGGCPSP